MMTSLCCEVLSRLKGKTLVTAESLSAYIAYGAYKGMPDANRTVVSNIHRMGTPAVEAGAHIVDLIKLMLEKKASGLDLNL